MKELLIFNGRSRHLTSSLHCQKNEELGVQSEAIKKISFQVDLIQLMLQNEGCQIRPIPLSDETNLMEEQSNVLMAILAI